MTITVHLNLYAGLIILATVYLYQHRHCLSMHRRHCWPVRLRVSNAAYVNALLAEGSAHRFLLDSGANVHITNDKQFFTSFDTSKHKQIRVTGIAGRTARSAGVGTISIPVLDAVTGSVNRLKVSNVYYIPQQPISLLSLSRLLAEHDIASNPD